MNNALAGVLANQQTQDALPVGNATQLTQGFQNLLANAIKFRGAQAHPKLPRTEGAHHA